MPLTRKATHLLTSRQEGSDRTIVRIGSDVAPSPSPWGAGPVECGGRALMIIAGPCAVEGEEMLLDIARAVRSDGANVLRGGAYKPRTSPYSFRGLGVQALELLAEARRETGLPIVTEVLDPRDVELVAEHADILQIGARNMQNYALLAEVGQMKRPVLLKRGFSATIDELLMAAEHVMTNGNENVILCERGIRTFESKTRNTLDVSSVPVLHAETHLPVIVDPSHAAGRADLIAPLAYAAIAAGADGLMIEVHPDPATARSDGEQSLSLDAFTALMVRLGRFAAAADRFLLSPASDEEFPVSVERPRSADDDGPSSRVPPTLPPLRAEIAALDREIAGLVGRRVQVAREAGRLKREAGMSVVDPLQESEVIHRVSDLAERADLPYTELCELQQLLIEMSRRAQIEDERE
jgi:3-deoxy-7-phosphoheptulonate synthase